MLHLLEYNSDRFVTKNGGNKDYERVRQAVELNATAHPLAIPMRIRPFTYL